MQYTHTEEINLFVDLAAGTDLEAKDTLWNYSALVWAALNDYLVVVKLLISAGRGKWCTLL